MRPQTIRVMKDTDGTLLVNSEPMNLQTAHRFIQSTLAASPDSIVLGENYSVGPLQTSTVRSHSEYAVFDFRGNVVERGFDPVKLYRMFSSEILDSGFTRLSKEKYPWEDCIKDQMEQYGDKETAEKVCGKIKAQSQGLGKKSSLHNPFMPTQSDNPSGEPTMRRTASEVIRNLESRVARLERRAGDGMVLSAYELERQLREEGITLPELGASTSEVKKHTIEVAKELGEGLAYPILTSRDGVKIKGLRAVKMGSYMALATSTDRLFCDLGLFQTRFKTPFVDSLYDQLTPQDEGDRFYPYKEIVEISERLMFVLEGDTFTIKLAR